VSLPTLVTASVADQIMRVVREAITKGILVPGERYSVEDVAERLGLPVSRTPVREALVRLADDGLVRFERNRGIRILKGTVTDLVELFQLRISVEVAAAYRAAQHVDGMLVHELDRELFAMAGAARARAELADGGTVEDLERINRDFVEHDTKFHELILGAAGNQRLVHAVRNWRDITTAIGGWKLAESNHLNTVLAEHERVVKALRNQNPHETAEAMYEHLKKTGTMLMEELQKIAGGTFDSTWYEGVAVPID
jgi:DNA-binding GntR family transcriptional regulator